jgi:hypothetical protein
MAVIGAAAIAGMEATAETMAWENLWVPGCSFARHSILGPSDHPHNESDTFDHRWRSALLFLSLLIHGPTCMCLPFFFGHALVFHGSVRHCGSPPLLRPFRLPRAKERGDVGEGDF